MTLTYKLNNIKTFVHQDFGRNDREITTDKPQHDPLFTVPYLETNKQKRGKQ